MISEDDLRDSRWKRIFGEALGPDPPLRFHDARCGSATADCKYIVTSPNSDYVPLPVYGKVALKIYSDGRFGKQDPILWPQLFTPDNPWMVAIRRKPDDAHEDSVMWRDVIPSDFRPSAPGSSLGSLSLEFLADLKRSVDAAARRIDGELASRGANPKMQYFYLSMQQAVARLSLPASYRDMLHQVVCAQRFWLYAEAFIEFYLRLRLPMAEAHPDTIHLVNHNLMGAVTSDPATAQEMYRLGVPIWFLRTPAQFDGTSRLGLAVDAVLPSALPATSDGRLIYEGEAGRYHLYLIYRHSHLYSDIPLTSVGVPAHSVALAATASASRPSASMAALPSVVRTTREKQRSAPYATKVTKHRPEMGRNKFEDPKHDFMPESIPAWQKGLSEVNRGRGSPGKAWPYWTPEPALLLPDKAERCARYLENWIRARDGWLYVQANPQVTDTPAFVPQEWREFLNHNSKTATELEGEGEARRRKQAVLAVVDRICGLERMSAAPLLWFGQPFVAGLPMAKEVIWELFETGFRIELHQLHLLLRRKPHFEDPTAEMAWETLDQGLLSSVFPDDQLLRLQALPSARSGLGADGVRARAKSLDALRRVMRTWEGAPKELMDAPSLVQHPSDQYLQRLESIMAGWYAQAF
ncbi:hypothetical protein EUX98_g8858 [Antrodiella citrinella]|uniref:Uncharacterized protein n=1 Tax=Antrodiella citrinella TaxID=2447956 RepID=A0A4S4M3N0_9APHY|nr:hypothetical protein EUX98_g8858 [Antrodiella citrinella]